MIAMMAALVSLDRSAQASMITCRSGSAGAFAGPTAAPEAAQFSESVFFSGLSGVTRGIIILVSGLRVPVPLLVKPWRHRQRKMILVLATCGKTSLLRFGVGAIRIPIRIRKIDAE